MPAACLPPVMSHLLGEHRSQTMMPHLRQWCLGLKKLNFSWQMAVRSQTWRTGSANRHSAGVRTRVGRPLTAVVALRGLH